MANDLAYGSSPYGNAIIQRLMGLRTPNVSNNPQLTMQTTGQDPSQNISNSLTEMFNSETGPTPPGLTSVSPVGTPSGPGLVNPMQPGMMNQAILPQSPSLIKSPTGNYQRTTPPPNLPNSPETSSPAHQDRSGIIANRLAGIMNRRRGNNG